MYKDLKCTCRTIALHRRGFGKREFKKLLRRRRRQRRLKMNLYFTYESRDTLKSFTLFSL